MPRFVSELRQSLLLAGPIVAGQVGQMLMSLADSVMIGQVGTVPLAASAFASAVAHVLMIPGLGLLSPVSVRVAQAKGIDDHRGAGEELRHGLAIAIIAGIGCALLLFGAFPFLGYLDQSPEVVEESIPYLGYIGASLLPILLFHALKQFYEGSHRPTAPMWILMGGVLLNVILNWIFIYGKLGAPALGLAGAGLATLISRWAIVFALFAALVRSRQFAQDLPTRWLAPLHYPRLRSFLGVGVPIAFQYSFEVGAFSVAGILMGRFGAVPLAAHQIALSCAAFTFMFPLGLSMAAGVRVGQAFANGDHQRIPSIGRSCLVASGAIMLLFGLVFLFAGNEIASAFTRSSDVSGPAVVALAAKLLIVAGIFQLFDGTQVVAIGALRGLNDVILPTLITFVAYWVLAIPFAWILAFPVGLGPMGVWLGLAAGLATAAVFLATRFEIRAGQLARNRPA